jgi:hypothetical protein
MGVLQHDEFAQAVLDLVTNMAKKLHAAGKVGSVTACHCAFSCVKSTQLEPYPPDVQCAPMYLLHLPKCYTVGACNTRERGLAGTLPVHVPREEDWQAPFQCMYQQTMHGSSMSWPLLMACLCCQVLVLAIPPVVPSDPGRPGADLKHMQALAAVVDGFSLMTYDYTTGGPGPNFPLPWQERNAKELTGAAPHGSKGHKGGWRRLVDADGGGMVPAHYDSVRM